MFEYYKVLLGSSYLQPKLEKILILGLGGGSLIKEFALLFPNANITAVEINPDIIAIAKEFFNLQESAKVKIAYPLKE